MRSAVEINQITKSFGDTLALDNVSFKINPSELFGLIGPDGAGKTTLFRILATLLLPDKGTVTLLDMNVVNHFRQLRNKIGYMPGRFSLYQDLTVEENLRFYSKVFGTEFQKNFDLIRVIYSRLEPFKNWPSVAR
jgi:ABC-2 type transport system ATP-binding protein